MLYLVICILGLCIRNFKIVFVRVTFSQITRGQITVKATVILLDDKHARQKFRPRCVF